MSAASPQDRRRASRDRRDAPRVPLVAAVRHAGAPRFFLSQDLSARGMTILRPDTDALQVRSPLEVEFELPGGRFVRALARVAHDCAGGRCRRTGLEFMRVEIE
ncbi:MAG TPA: PilZ domain-containing protein [Polyangia bacterium]|nr:PilZ domain-containing protein [Polyangia bacterium]